MPKREVYAPVIGYHDASGAIGDGIDLGLGVRLIPTPDWVKDEEALRNLGVSRRLRVVEDCEFALFVSYDTSTPASPSCAACGEVGLPERVDAVLANAVQALWFAKPSRIGYDTTLHFDRPEDPRSLRHSARHPRAFFHQDDDENELTQEDFGCAAAIHAALCSLEPRSTTWIAVHLNRTALLNWLWVSTFLLHWVALESLFGSADPREETYRISHRIVTFIAEGPSEIRTLVPLVRKSYGWRSQVAHGLHRKGPGEKDLEIARNLEDVVRRCFSKLLLDKELIARFDGNDREAYLDGLLYDWFERVA